jgi:choline dehydrogenase
MDEQDSIEADYIVVGAGSAGCVLANRLSADPGNRVVVLEAGGDDRMLREPGQLISNYLMKVPAGFAYLLTDRKIIWDYVCENIASLNGRTLNYPRGKVLGGCSSINGMVYLRGLESDYHGWQQLGCTGWGWDDVLPMFRRMEDVEGRLSSAQGTGGPLRVSDYPGHWTMDRLLAACAEAGIASVENVNGVVQDGIAYSQRTTRNGRRESAATAFLHPVEHRRNLKIVTRALVHRIVFDGRRAVGVEYEAGNRRITVRARKDIILSAGAINTPQILELSGIGSGARLNAMGIDTLVDSPGVGENLSDHYSVGLRARLVPGTPSYNQQMKGLNQLGQIARYLLTGQGVLAQSIGALIGYFRSDPAFDMPDVQFMSMPASMDFVKTTQTGRTALDTEPGITLSGYQTHPRSRGSTHITSPSARAAPQIQLNYLTDPADQIGAVNILRTCRRILRQPSIAPLVDHELAPSGDIPDADFDGLLNHARNSGVTTYHPVSTCRMGPDEASVTDLELRVRGVEGLRIADASIMPTIVSANTNAACMMIGEMAATLILNAAR